MSNHLPECEMAGPICAGNVGGHRGFMFCLHCHRRCICGALRGCEQRVRLEDDDYAYVAAQAEADGRRQGWAAALNAVRESVERLPAHGRVAYSLAVSKAKVIEAIDALREKP